MLMKYTHQVSQERALSDSDEFPHEVDTLGFCAGQAKAPMSFNNSQSGSALRQDNAQPRTQPRAVAENQASGFAQMLQSVRQSINRNMEPFSEGLHKVVDGNADKDGGYESDAEASVPEVGPTA